MSADLALCINADLDGWVDISVAAHEVVDDKLSDGHGFVAESLRMAHIRFRVGVLSTRMVTVQLTRVQSVVRTRDGDFRPRSRNPCPRVRTPDQQRFLCGAPGYSKRRDRYA